MRPARIAAVNIGAVPAVNVMVRCPRSGAAPLAGLRRKEAARQVDVDEAVDVELEMLENCECAFTSVHDTRITRPQDATIVVRAIGPSTIDQLSGSPGVNPVLHRRECSRERGGEARSDRQATRRHDEGVAQHAAPDLTDRAVARRAELSSVGSRLYALHHHLTNRGIHDKVARETSPFVGGTV
jgi:hypothetical protein